ncbi:MAG: hypothetical protein AB1505_11800 [Candidatus Latescibacterota bacterium]
MHQVGSTLSLRTVQARLREAQEYARRVTDERAEIEREFSGLAGEVSANLRTLQEYRRYLGGAAYVREVLDRWSLGVLESGRLDPTLLDRLSAREKQQLHEELTGCRDAASHAASR